MSKYSKFGVDTFNIFWVTATLKFLHNKDDNEDKEDNNDNLAITVAWLILRNKWAKKFNKQVIFKQTKLNSQDFDYL